MPRTEMNAPCPKATSWAWPSESPTRRPTLRSIFALSTSGPTMWTGRPTPSSISPTSSTRGTTCAKHKAGQYEKPIVAAPDGDSWFHAKIVIERPKVSVYVNDAKEPSLVVEELSDRKDRGVGLWVGPGQGGHFANLKITPVK